MKLKRITFAVLAVIAICSTVYAQDGSAPAEPSLPVSETVLVAAANWLASFLVAWTVNRLKPVWPNANPKWVAAGIAFVLSALVAWLVRFLGPDTASGVGLFVVGFVTQLWQAVGSFEIAMKPKDPDSPPLPLSSRSRTTALLLVPVLSLSIIASPGCKPRSVATNPSQPPSTAQEQQDATMREIATQSDRIAKSLEALGAIKREAYKQKLISLSTREKITQASIKAVEVAEQFNTRAQTYTKFDPASRADLARLFLDVVSSLDELEKAGVTNLEGSSAIGKQATTVISAIANARGILNGFFPEGVK